MAETDALYVASPNNTHAGYISCGLEGKKHVLCTKPLTDTSLSCEKLKKTIADLPMTVSCGNKEPGQIKFMYEDHYLYNPITLKLIANRNNSEYFNLEKLGRLERLTGHFEETPDTSRMDSEREKWLLNPSISGGGVWVDNGVHLQIILRGLGAKLLVKSAASSRISPYGGELRMACKATLNTIPGCTNTLLNWSQTPAEFIVEKNAQRTRKEIIFHFERGDIILNYIEKSIHQIAADGQTHFLHADTTDSYAIVADTFVKLIAGGEDRRRISMVEAMEEMQIVRQVYDAASGARMENGSHATRHDAPHHQRHLPIIDL